LGNLLSLSDVTINRVQALEVNGEPVDVHRIDGIVLCSAHGWK